MRCHAWLEMRSDISSSYRCSTHVEWFRAGIQSDQQSGNLVSDLVYRFVVIAKVYVDQTDNKTDSDLGQAQMKAAEQENDAMCHDAHVTKPDAQM